MHFIRPAWLCHAAARKNEVYCCHVSPDGERLATGGLDCNVRIWSTEAIFKSKDSAQQADDPNKQLPKQLCSLSHHTGAVHTVRFSGNNRYLASGSDDKIVLVYERDLNAIPSTRPVFGSNEAPHAEIWRTHRRLDGHDNDVQDVGWSADSSILVSVGLDSKVVVWSGSTFERLKRIDVHQSHVKGLAFDPANKYFATASDDRSVKVFRFTPPASNATAHDQVTNYVLEHSITQPFQESPNTTYFRRCSWSPDGSHIAAANAVNGPVSSVAIINRGSWDSEINLIGHEGPVEVCAFAPRMFSKTPLVPGVQQPAPVTVIACAGHDKALSIWNTSNPRPLIITQDLATKGITDLGWSPDGKSLFITSLDGSIVCICFEEGDLGYVLGVEENDRILQKFGAGRKGATLPEGTESMRLEDMSKTSERREVEGRMGELMMDGRNGMNGSIPVAASGPNVGPQWQMQAQVPPALPPPPPSREMAEKEKERLLKQKVTITKDGKKRIAPLLVSSGGGQRSNLPNAQLLQGAAGASNSGASDPKLTLDLSRPYDGLPKGGMTALMVGNKRRFEEDEENQGGVTHGKRLAILSGADEIRKRADDAPEFIRPAVISPALSTSQVRLGVPKVRTFVNRVIDATGQPSANVPSVNGESAAGQPGSSSVNDDTVFEARNSRAVADREPCRLTISKGGQILSVDFLPKPVLLVTGNSNFWCAGCEDGTIHVYTPVGRRLMSPLVLDAQPCFLESRGWWLMCITAVGMAHVWNIKTTKSAHPPVSLAPVLDVANTYQKVDGLSKAEAITEAGVNSEGTVMVSLTNGDGFAYNREMCIWQKITEAWWAVASQYWDTAGSARALAGSSNLADGALDPRHPAISAGVIQHLERRTTGEVLMQGRGRFLQRIVKQLLSREGFEMFEAAVSISHLENRMAAAITMHAREDFKTYLLMYAKRIAAEGMKGKVEELLRELMGRLDVDEDEDREDGDMEDDADEIVGWPKKELLKAVLVAIGKHRDLQRITLPYARIMGIMETEDEET